MWANNDRRFWLEPWWSELQACQEEIMRLDPHPYYVENYRPAEVYYWHPIAGWLYADIDERPPSSCLDIGCAYGTLLLYVRRLAACQAYGIDFIDVYMSRSLRTEYGLHFAVSNIELDPLPWQKTFDIILLTEVLEHFNFNPIPTLQKIRELLSPDGSLYLSTPDALEWGRVTKYFSSYIQMPMPIRLPGQVIVDDHIWLYDQTELLEIIGQAGLWVERIDYSSGLSGRHFNLKLRRRNI